MNLVSIRERSKNLRERSLVSVPALGVLNFGSCHMV